MSPIATLENLEPYLSHVVISEKSSTPTPRPALPEAREVMSNGRQGSHLEIFFSEVKYKTFITQKAATPKTRESKHRSGNGHSEALKYRLKLH